MSPRKLKQGQADGIMIPSQTSLHKDDRKTLAFVLIYRKSLLTDVKQEKLEYFIWRLSLAGIKIEAERFSADADLIFVKLHASNDVVFRYADVCDIDLACRNDDYRPDYDTPASFLATPLTMPDPNDPVFKRAPESVSMDIPSDVTSAEKILIMVALMNRTKFGQRPIHDGGHEWTETGDLNDRQLLARYWGNARCWYKCQPLHTIERYFGTEYAFYFAWLGFYIKMLIPASALGIICVVFGAFTCDSSYFNYRSYEICNSDLIMCPKCHYEGCTFDPLSGSCGLSKMCYIFENPTTIALAVITSFWSTCFMEYWQRTQTVLAIRWNVRSLDLDPGTRPQYIEAATTLKYSPITRRMEPFVSTKKICVGYVITATSIFLLCTVMLLAVMAVIVYQVSTTYLIAASDLSDQFKAFNDVFITLTGAAISAIFIHLFTLIYEKLAMLLTNMENHRTQFDFDHSYIYKSFALAFVNNYAAVFYIAFFKGRFYEHPGRMQQWHEGGGLRTDVCSPSGCIPDLSISLMTIMIIKIAFSHISQYMWPIIRGKYKQLFMSVPLTEHLPAHEKQYLQTEAEEYFLVNEYMDLVIQYGYIVCFIAALPLSPAVALISNVIELRVDAYKITTSFRRPIPKRVTGIGAWFGILQAMTYLGVVTNALVIAVTSEFVPMSMYKYFHSGDVQGFINTTLSSFRVSDFTIIPRSDDPPEYCYYMGWRYPPDHPKEYLLTDEFWMVVAIRMVAILSFEVRP
nr:unnamed protein product [Callosobruchus chinensis]